MKLMYRVPEAVEASGLARTRLYELMAAGEIESVKVGRARLIPGDALLAYVERVRQGAAAVDGLAPPSRAQSHA